MFIKVFLKTFLNSTKNVCYKISNYRNLYQIFRNIKIMVCYYSIIKMSQHVNTLNRSSNAVSVVYYKNTLKTLHNLFITSMLYNVLAYGLLTWWPIELMTYSTYDLPLTVMKRKHGLVPGCHQNPFSKI